MGFAIVKTGLDFKLINTETGQNMSDDAKKSPLNMVNGKTNLNFPFIAFEDFNHSICKLEISSLIDYDAVTLGVCNSKAIILNRDAKRLGLVPENTVGWMDYPMPEGVSIISKMHLTRSDVASLLPVLQHYVKTGELPNVSVNNQIEEGKIYTNKSGRTREVIGIGDKYIPKRWFSKMLRPEGQTGVLFEANDHLQMEYVGSFIAWLES